jgi:hypothetical protein
MKGAQENLRLSAQQNQKITRELTEFKDKISVNNQ